MKSNTAKSQPSLYSSKITSFSASRCFYKLFNKGFILYGFHLPQFVWFYIWNIQILSALYCLIGFRLLLLLITGQIRGTTVWAVNPTVESSLHPNDLLKTHRVDNDGFCLTLLSKIHRPPQVQESTVAPNPVGTLNNEVSRTRLPDISSSDHDSCHSSWPSGCYAKFLLSMVFSKGCTRCSVLKIKILPLQPWFLNRSNHFKNQNVRLYRNVLIAGVSAQHRHQLFWRL